MEKSSLSLSLSLSLCLCLSLSSSSFIPSLLSRSFLPLPRSHFLSCALKTDETWTEKKGVCAYENANLVLRGSGEAVIESCCQGSAVKDSARERAGVRNTTHLPAPSEAAINQRASPRRPGRYASTTTNQQRIPSERGRARWRRRTREKTLSFFPRGKSENEVEES